MKRYDITQELFHCSVFPGDPKPSCERVMEIKRGDVCNLTSLSLCAHNGTHVDAPFHFYQDGKTVEELELKRLVGHARVASFEGALSAADVDVMMQDGPRRILIKGKAIVTEEAARAFLRHGVWLIGVESQTVGPEDAPAGVHLLLLKQEVVLLEGIRLSEVPEGNYFLFAAPLKLGGADGAPCRAVLIDRAGAFEEQDAEDA